ncbi:MAG: 2-amino-4-hydroxy-6-hydroxymethyldihydropteridine diphosphokinase [Chloroherpetonaceae bacterium]|nr:2-amino-4-hydroxy-6-hydroxymethyldihydropteridine diphosphokinase [Chloroherpetonaceae bacterium]
MLKWNMRSPENDWHLVWLGAGANVAGKFGIPHETLETALNRLQHHLSLRVLKGSSFWESPALTTEGIDYSKPPYLNAVWLIETKLSPEELLRELKQLEKESGREPRKKWESRPLDLDILFYDQLVIKSDVLTIPHPELHRREFVLRPLLEVGNPIHPIFNSKCSDLLKILESDSTLSSENGKEQKSNSTKLTAKKLSLRYSPSSES